MLNKATFRKRSSAWGPRGAAFTGPFWHVLLLAASLLSIAAAAYGQAATIKLSVVPDAGGSSADPGTYHFRPEEADSRQGISHVFTLKNDTAGPVTIVRIDTSCSCTTALLQAGSAGQAPAGSDNITLSPGQQCQVKVTVGIGDGAQGDIDKIASVHIANQAEPAAILHIIGTIDPPVMFVPASLDFGTVAAGKERDLTFSVGFSPRAPSPGNDPAVVSSVSYLKVVPDKQPLPDSSFPKSYRVLFYKAILPADAAMGELTGTVSLETPAQPSTSAPAGALVLGAGTVTTAPVSMPSMPPASIPVRGNITGDLLAQPSTAIFGTVSAGHQANATVVVSSKTRGNLSRMTFSSDQPWLSATVTGPGGVPGSWVIQIKISPTAPAGADTAGVVGEVEGEKIAIPVQAYIVSEGK